MKKFIRDIMYDRIDGFWITLIKRDFWVWSKIFFIIVYVRNKFYNWGWKKTRQASRPVISVGNITVGGSGKTPTVIYLAQEIRKMGYRPAILTRGYMRETGSGSDEAKMMLHKLKDVPIIVGANRSAEAEDFLKDDDCDIFIMDDGFQHRRLRRNLDIVLMDATYPWGNGQLMPRGILREPVSALERTDVILLTRTDQAQKEIVAIKQKVHEICPDKIYCESVHEPKGLFDLKTSERWDVQALRGKSVYAVSSIAHPRAFEKTLTHLGADIHGASHFLDHHVYSEANIEQLIADVHFQKVDYVVTTEKDEQKLAAWRSRFDTIPWLSVRIELDIQTGKDALLERVAELLDR